MKISDKSVNPSQHQDIQPSIESMMHPKLIFIDQNYVGSNKLEGNLDIVTLVIVNSGDSGIGRAVLRMLATHH